MDGFFERPALIAAVAFIGGAVVAAVVFFVIVSGGDNNGGPAQVRATGTAVTTTATRAPRTPTSVDTATPATTPTSTPKPTNDPEDALAGYVQNELHETYVGGCPQEPPPGGAPQGICSIQLFRGDDLVTYNLGHPLSDGIGEAVLTKQNDGSWSISFISMPPVGGSQLSVGAQAVVLGAGNCLNFREEPSRLAKIVSCEIDGTRAQVAEGPVAADDIMWWRLEGLGWASDEFIFPAQ